MRNRKRKVLRSQLGVMRARHSDDMETAKALELMDDIKMNENFADPKQALPHPRSDLPKNKHHESIHSN